MPKMMKKQFVIKVIALSLLLAVSAAATAEDGRGVQSSAIDKSAPIQALDTLSSIKNAQPLSVTVPKIDEFTTKSGIKVLLVQTPTLPIVDVALRFNAGSARDGDIRPNGFGIAGMTAAMLTQGTKSLTEDDFTKAAETLGINLSSMAYQDMFIVSLRSLSDDEHLLPAADLMAQMLTEPNFDSTILERNKSRQLVGLKQQKQDPAYLAAIAFSDALYGDHPYAHPAAGTLETVPTIKREDLTQFWQRYLVANNASMAITGNVTRAEAEALANRLTKNLPQGQAASALPEPKPLTEPKRIHIPFDSTQTTVLMGQLGNKRATNPKAQQEQTNFAVGNDVLAGGDFNARLMTEVRQNLGYTYGISGGMSPMLTRGPYQISFSTRNDKARAAIDASLKVINDTLKDGITQSEMQLTKDGLKNSFPMSFSSNAAINGQLGMMNFYQLPNDYLANFEQRINAVTLTSVNQSLRNNLQPDKFLIVTVGKNNPWENKTIPKKKSKR